MNKRSVFIIYPPFIQVLRAAGAADVIFQRIENQTSHQSEQNITQGPGFIRSPTLRDGFLLGQNGSVCDPVLETDVRRLCLGDDSLNPLTEAELQKQIPLWKQNKYL